MTFEDETTPNLDEPGQLKAARGSGLAQLRGRRAQAVEKLHIDLPVQRSEELLGQRVIVRYRALAGAELERMRKRFAKNKSDDVDTVANASSLALACLGVFTEAERDDPSSWMKFDTELAALIKDVDEDQVTEKSGAEVVRLLYFTDGDVSATAMKLTEFSGYSIEGLEEDNAGN